MKMSERDYRKQIHKDLHKPAWIHKVKVIIITILLVLFIPLAIISFADPRTWMLFLGVFILSPWLNKM